MKQVKAHIAVSLDGHIATLDNELDWLPDEVKAIVGKHCQEADGWPYKSQRSFVVSHHDTNVTPGCGVEFLTEEPLRRVYELKQAHDILVVGGGKLLTSLIKAELLDCLTLYFIGETFGSQWKLSESGVLDGGVVRSTYLFGKTAIE